MKQIQFATSIWSCISNLKQSRYAMLLQYDIVFHYEIARIFTFLIFHLCSDVEIQYRLDFASSLFHLQFATSFHRLKSPLFWRWNFAKRIHKSKENRCFGLKCNFASHPCFTVSSHLRSNVKILQKCLNQRQNDVESKVMRLHKTNSFFCLCYAVEMQCRFNLSSRLRITVEMGCCFRIKIFETVVKWGRKSSKFSKQ